MTSFLQWFNDVFSTEISDKCEDVLNRLLENHGCKVYFHAFLIIKNRNWNSSALSSLLLMQKMVEIVIPELHEMRTAHIVSIGSESACGLNPDYEDGYAHLPQVFYLFTLCLCV